MTKSVVPEGFRLVSAGERLAALLPPLSCVVQMTGRVRELAPELDPELDQLEARLVEMLAHIQAAMDVLSAKGSLL